MSKVSPLICPYWNALLTVRLSTSVSLPLSYNTYIYSCVLLYKTLPSYSLLQRASALHNLSLFKLTAGWSDFLTPPRRRWSRAPSWPRSRSRSWPPTSCRIRTPRRVSCRRGERRGRRVSGVAGPKRKLLLLSHTRVLSHFKQLTSSGVSSRNTVQIDEIFRETGTAKKKKKKREMFPNRNSVTVN